MAAAHVVSTDKTGAFQVARTNTKFKITGRPDEQKQPPCLDTHKTHSTEPDGAGGQTQARSTHTTANGHTADVNVDADTATGCA
jgi:hypothetical protein